MVQSLEVFPAPSAVVLPVWHAVQPVAEGSWVYLPTAHFSHVNSPVDDRVWNIPATHVLHQSGPVAFCGTHAGCPGPPVVVPETDTDLPVAQLVHIVAAFPSENLPMSQSLQLYPFTY